MERRVKTGALDALWSVRMRASKRVKGQGARGKGHEVHISGAEGLYGLSEIDKAVKNYYKRAIEHPRGLPDRIVITVEKPIRKPIEIPLLPVSTMRSDSHDNSKKILKTLLLRQGVSVKAIQNAMKVVYGRRAMRGASLIRAESGIRVEPDRKRGVRVSMLGIDKGSEKAVSRKLSMSGINTATVKEALTLASKVASCIGVIAELCISDDPDYTTGYIASKAAGYVRIPNIKQKRSLSGGRVFFVEDGADVERIIGYLEKTPVIAVTRL